MNTIARMKLFTALGICVAGMVAAGFLLAIGLHKFSTERFLTQAVRDSAVAGTEAIAAAAEAGLDSGGLELLEEIIFKAQESDPILHRLTLADATCRVVCDTIGRSAGSMIEDFEDPGEAPHVMDARSSDGLPVVRVITPVFGAAKRWGFLQAEYALSHIEDQAWTFLTAAAGGFLVILLFGVLMLSVIRRHHSTTLAGVRRVVEEVTRGRLSARTGIRCAGELGRLAEAVDAMAARLARSDHEASGRLNELEERLALRSQALDDATRGIEDAKLSIPSSQMAKG